jgi:hypothetical protein
MLRPGVGWMTRAPSWSDTFSAPGAFVETNVNSAVETAILENMLSFPRQFLASA